MNEKSLVTALLLVIAAIGWIIFDTIRGPLSHLPGPFYSKWTNLFLKYKAVVGEKSRYVHSLHEKYGRIVRISPQEVSIVDIAAAKIIYKVGGLYVKSEWYNAITGGQKAKSLFSATDAQWHGKHRRLLAANFAEKNVAAMEPYIAKNVQLAIKRMKEDAQAKGYVDIFKWFMFMASIMASSQTPMADLVQATDVIGEASFGESFRLLEVGEKTRYMLDLEAAGQFGILRSEFPTFFNIMKRVPIGPHKEVGRMIGRLQAYAHQSTQRYWKQLQNDPDNVKPTLLTKEYAEVENGNITSEQLDRDAQTNLIGGTDSTAITATYAVWFLAQHPEIEAAVIEEVATLPDGFDDTNLRCLNTLCNVISETHRLRGAVSASLPRLVPHGGADFCGYFIPEQMIVGIPAYSMHRDPAIWSEPERFVPSRWDNPSKDMLHSFLPFGGGSRVCIGSHFAQVELRHALANFYRTFSTGVRLSTAENFSDADMVAVAYLFSPPKGKRCLVEPKR